MIAVDALMPESAVLNNYPVLSLSRLRRARAEGEIAWVKGKRGSAWYRPSAIETFITEHMETPCHDNPKRPSLNSADNGSPKNRERRLSVVTGLSPDQVEHAALACAQKI